MAKNNFLGDYVLYVHGDHRDILERFSDEELLTLFKMLMHPPEDIPNNRVGDIYITITKQNRRFEEAQEEFSKKQSENIKKRWNKNSDKENTEIENFTPVDTTTIPNIPVDTDNIPLNTTVIPNIPTITNTNTIANTIANTTPSRTPACEENHHPSARTKKNPQVDYQLILDSYNSICTNLPKTTILSEARKKAINARLKSGYTLDSLINAFKMAQESNFLCGANEKNWTADLDWILCDRNIAKILDGKYINKSPTTGQNPQLGGSNVNNPNTTYQQFIPSDVAFGLVDPNQGNFQGGGYSDGS
jgi:hypothetical protein